MSNPNSCPFCLNQKNGTQGELVGQGWSGHPQWCQVQAVIHRNLHLCRAPPTTPLYSYYDNGRWNATSTSILTHHLCATTSTLGTTWDITAADISIHSLRSSGIMVLLCMAINPDKIWLLGCWRLDEMLRCLHVQAFPIGAPLAAKMFQHGNFAMIPNNHLPLLGY